MGLVGRIELQDGKVPTLRGVDREELVELESRYWQPKGDFQWQVMKHRIRRWEFWGIECAFAPRFPENASQAVSKETRLPIHHNMI